MGKVCRFPGCVTVLRHENRRDDGMCSLHQRVLVHNNISVVGGKFLTDKKKRVIVKGKYKYVRIEMPRARVGLLKETVCPQDILETDRL